MIIDSSAICSIALKEPTSERLLSTIIRSEVRLMSAASYLEAAIVVDSRADTVASNQLDTLLTGLGITIEPVTERQSQIARQAYRDYGRSSTSSAKLNFGDCFAYALAKDKNQPLLFVGDDFNKTDLYIEEY